MEATLRPRQIASKSTTPAMLLVLVGLSAACAQDPSAPEPLERHASSSGPLAPLVERSGGAGLIPGRYIVVLRDGSRPAASVAREVVAASGGALRGSYGRALRGFVATLTDAELERLRGDADVAYVEQDAVVRATANPPAAPWHLDRISQRALPLNGMYAWAPGGDGVHAYVIDSGVRFTHEEFGGRATSGFDAIDGGAADDCNGHGTHVAATLGGASYGVAKRVSLIAVRVLDCWGVGSTSGVIAGVDWVAANHVAPAVANLSLVGGASRALDEAVARAIDAGVVVVVAAGNDARDACGFSPARAPAAITVGASTSADARWALSNFGACVDLFAPGAEVTSASSGSDGATAVLSGTSMAAPIVAGVVALHLGASPGADRAAVAAAITEQASAGRLTSVGAGSPNRLLFVPADATWWVRWQRRWGAECSFCSGSTLPGR